MDCKFKAKAEWHRSHWHRRTPVEEGDQPGEEDAIITLREPGAEDEEEDPPRQRPSSRAAARR